jgi:hypothetical protein
MGDREDYSPSVGVEDIASYIPQNFDDGIALTYEYLAEWFEFSYSVLKKFCSLRSHFKKFA